MRLLVLILALLLGGASWAAGQSASAKTLLGLPGLEVLIEGLDADATGVGLTKNGLQTDVELQLRLAGIHVASDAESNGLPPYPWVYVNVKTIKSPTTGLFAYSVDVTAEQWVTLASGKGTLATTWHTGTIGTVGANNFSSAVRETVKDQINKLLNDWLSVNPKK